jgi:Patatin-like phospholipase
LRRRNTAMNIQIQSHLTAAKRHLPFECVALVLQGGGALGAYQAGVYEALAEAGIDPDWVAGVSIGAINSAIIAGNEPTERVAKLRTFWQEISANPLLDWSSALHTITPKLGSIRTCGAPVMNQFQEPAYQCGLTSRAPELPHETSCSPLSLRIGFGLAPREPDREAYGKQPRVTHHFP